MFSNVINDSTFHSGYILEELVYLVLKSTNMHFRSSCLNRGGSILNPIYADGSS